MTRTGSRWCREHRKWETDAERIGEIFASLLRYHLGPAKFREMVRRNADESNADVCHSHDYVDANVLMADAFRKVKGYAPHDEPGEITSEADRALWDRSWKAANLR